MGIIPQAVAALVREEETDKAFRHIMEQNPLAWVCAEICSYPCSQSCKLRNIGRQAPDMRILERDVIRQEIQDENFLLEEPVKLGVLPDYQLLKDQATSQVVGSGTLRLDRTGLSYHGTKDGEAFQFHIPSHALPTYGMCTDLSRFYTFLNGQFLEFYPEHRVVEKFFLATEELHRLNGGRWQAAPNP